jgi:hypothetical protein
MTEICNPLPTRSGYPHLSPEQRDYFDQNKEECLKSCNGDAGMMRQFYGDMYNDFEKWRVFDLVEPCCHPVHINLIMALSHLDTCKDMAGRLEGAKSMDKVTEEQYLEELAKLRYQELLALSEWDLDAKRELRKIKSIMKEQNTCIVVQKTTPSDGGTSEPTNTHETSLSSANAVDTTDTVAD